MEKDYKEDWVFVSLAKDLNYVKTGVSKYSETKKYYSTGSIKEDSIISEGAFTYSNRPSRANRLGYPGDVLQARMKDTDKAILINNKLGQQLFSTGFIQIRPNPNTLLSKYLFYYLKSIVFLNEKDKRCTGSTQTSLNDKSAQYLSIPLPPLPIQRAIVTKIENLFFSLDKGIADLKKAQEQLNVYRQAVLKKAFEGELTREWRENNKPKSSYDFLKNISEDRKAKKPEKGSIYHKKISHEFKFQKSNKVSSWAVGTLDRLVYIAARIGWRGLKKSEYTEGGPLFLSVHSLNHGKFVDYSEAYHISEARYLESPEIQLKEGDVLLCKDGAGIGKIGIIKNLKKKATVNSSLLVIRGLEILNQEFIYYLFSGPALQSIVFERITGSATPHLFQNDIRKFELQIPPKEEQHQIVREIESRLSVCDKVEQNITEGLEKAKSLRQSILKKAFEGKLLSVAEIEQCKQEADYEPASVLLEKIKNEKQDKTKAGEKVSTDIQAGVIAKIIKLHEDKPEYYANLSHVKCEKISHLAEYHVQIALGRKPVKDAAGPDDFPHLKKVEHRAKMAGYFFIKKQEIGHTYQSGRNLNKAIDILESKISAEQSEQLDKLINMFLQFDLERAEIVATLYAGWNNLLLQGKIPTDEEIVRESRENWSKRKLSLERSRFFKALEWMRKNELIPSGNGKLVNKPIKSRI